MGLIGQKCHAEHTIHTARMFEMPPPRRNVVIDVGGVQIKWRLKQKRGGRPLLGLPWLDNIGFATYKTVQRNGVVRG